MPTLRFEAPSLEEALETARRETGQAMKVTSATRVRRGGVAGFFAREHVEVQVEVGDDAVAAPKHRLQGEHAKAPATAGKHPESGAKGTNGAKANGAHGPGAGDDHRDVRGEHLLPTATKDPLAELVSEMSRGTPSSVLDLAEQVNHEQPSFALTTEPEARPAPKLPARRRAAPESVVRDRVVPARAVPERGVPSRGGPERGGPERGGPERAAGERPSAAPSKAGAITPAAAALEAPRAGFAAILKRVAKDPGQLDQNLGAEGAERLETQAQPRAGTAPLTPASSTAPLTPASSTAPLTPAAALVPAKSTTSAAGAPEHSFPGQALAALGLPSHAFPTVAPSATLGELETQLCRALDRALPKVPTMPTTAGGVVAVVGPRDRVVETARALAAQVGSPASEIALATQRELARHAGVLEETGSLISSPEAAGEQRRGWRWRDHPTVVAIEAEPRPDGDRWASSVLRALAPTVCWGVAEAHRKAEDIAAWSEALGGLDVLALVDLGTTTTPAAVLAAALPVGLLETERATAELWASVLCSRLKAPRHSPRAEP